MPKKNTIAYWKGLSDNKDILLTDKAAEINRLEELLNNIARTLNSKGQDRYSLSITLAHNEIIPEIAGLMSLVKKMTIDEEKRRGAVDMVYEALKEENSKLWYMVRLSAGDKSLEDELKPGEEYSVIDNRINRPFRNPINQL